MAVSPLAPQGFKAQDRSQCRLWGLNLTTSGVVMDQDWNQTAFLAHSKRKRLGGCLRTVGPKTSIWTVSMVYRDCSMLRGLALIKDKSLRRRRDDLLRLNWLTEDLGQTMMDSRALRLLHVQEQHYSTEDDLYPPFPLMAGERGSFNSPHLSLFSSRCLSHLGTCVHTPLAVSYGNEQ